MCLIVVAVTDVGGSDEQLEGVVLLQVQRPCVDLLLELPHTFLAVTEESQSDRVNQPTHSNQISPTARSPRGGPTRNDANNDTTYMLYMLGNLPAEAKLFLVAPENGGSGFD